MEVSSGLDSQACRPFVSLQHTQRLRKSIEERALTTSSAMIRRAASPGPGASKSKGRKHGERNGTPRCRLGARRLSPLQSSAAHARCVSELATRIRRLARLELRARLAKSIVEQPSLSV